MKHKPNVLDNVSYWKLFDNDKQSDNLLQPKGEFENFHTDIQNIVKDDGQQNIL